MLYVDVKTLVQTVTFLLLRYLAALIYMAPVRYSTLNPKVHTYYIVMTHVTDDLHNIIQLYGCVPFYI